MSTCKMHAYLDIVLNSNPVAWNIMLNSKLKLRSSTRFLVSKTKLRKASNELLTLEGPLKVLDKILTVTKAGFSPNHK